MDEVERIARELAKAAGVDPDGITYEDILTPRPKWRLYEDQAREQMQPRALELVEHNPDQDYTAVSSFDFGFYGKGC